MFRSKTLFVLGAGSSVEVGMPTGDRLKESISEKLNIKYSQFDSYLVSGDRGVDRALLRFAEEGDGGCSPSKATQQIQKAHSLRESLPHAISIDNLLDANRDDKLVEICGKLGIFQSILEAERKSKLFFDEKKGSKFLSVTEAWFLEFIKILTEDISKIEIGNIFKNISFINFNYDRCLEHYLSGALKSYYDLDENLAKDTVKTLKVLRPYGSVGDLPWQSDDPNLSVAFGSDRFLSDNDLGKIDKGVELLNKAKQIKTFNEKQHDPQALKELHAAIMETENIVFLGFAFHRQNLELLRPEGSCKAKKIFATKMGISSSDWFIIQKEIISLLSPEYKHVENINSLDAKCLDLFKEFRRTLTS